MQETWTRFLTIMGIGVALAVLAVACGSGGDSAVADGQPATESTAEPAEAAAVADPEPTPIPEPTTPPEPTAPPEPTPTAEPPAPTPLVPEESVVDVATFEQFPLPDYVTEKLEGDYLSYLIEVEPGVHVHVLETGTGYPVYMQHGAPTSGLLYRKVAAELPTDEFRVILPTMVGLGFSSGVDRAEHTLDNHVRWMQLALEQLGIDELIFVGHDWGGPVGLGALTRSPDLLEGAVILNTSLVAPTEPLELNPALAALLSQPPGSEAALNAAIFAQLPAAQNDIDSLSPDVVDLYRRPIDEGDNVVGPVSILGMAADGPDHPTAAELRAVEAYVAQLDVPTEIVWGTKDPVLGPRLDAMITQFPNAAVTRTEAGHFLQEEPEVPAEIAAAIQRVRSEIEG